MKVKKHKTFTTHGPVNLVMTPTIYNWMKIFISKFRYPLADNTSNDDEPVFLTWGNKPMHSSQIGVQMGSAWGKVFGEEAGTGGATAFKKSAVSAVNRHDKSKREALAELMAHNKVTADKYYVLKEEAEKAVETSKYLTGVLCGASAGAPQAQKDDTTGKRHVEDPETPSSSEEWSTAMRRKWQPEEEEIKVFADKIRNQNVKMDLVRKKMKNNCVINKISAQKVRDKIRSYFGTVERQLPTIPEETSQDRLKRAGYRAAAPSPKATQPENELGESGSVYQPSENVTPSLIPPTTCTTKKSSQKLFVNDEYEVFYDLFKDLIESKKPISRPLVKERIEEPRLKHVLDKCTLLQLADKVRTERRIIAREKSRNCEYTLLKL